MGQSADRLTVTHSVCRDVKILEEITGKKNVHKSPLQSFHHGRDSVPVLQYLWDRAPSL